MENITQIYKHVYVYIYIYSIYIHIYIVIYIYIYLCIDIFAEHRSAKYVDMYGEYMYIYVSAKQRFANCFVVHTTT